MSQVASARDESNLGSLAKFSMPSNQRLPGHLTQISQLALREGQRAVHALFAELPHVGYHTRNFLSLCDDHPSIVGMGKNGVVLSAGRLQFRGVDVPLVAKIKGLLRQQNTHLLLGQNVGHKSGVLSATVNSLKSLGFPNVVGHFEVERRIEYRTVVETDENTASAKEVLLPAYHICPDLRANGTSLFEVDQCEYDLIKNGDEVRNEVRAIIHHLENCEREGLSDITIDGHSREEGFQHSLFVLKDRFGFGYTCFGDLNHLVVEPRGVIGIGPGLAPRILPHHPRERVRTGRFRKSS